MRILLVMDDPADRVRWEATIRERGHLAVSARPGPAAWRQATAGGLDLVIARHRYGDGDARRLIIEMRDAAMAPPRPALMVLLDDEDSGLLLTLLQEGADDVLIGDVDPPTLRLRLVAAERRNERRVGAPPTAPVLVRVGEPLVAMPAALPPLPTPPPSVGPLADALAAASAAAAEAYQALPADPAAARAELRLVLEMLRAVHRSAEALLGPLPLPSRAPKAAPPPDAPPLAPLNTDDRVLVVLAEDDEHVRRPLRRTLEHVGLEVLEAGDGETALRLVLEHAARVRLVITDHRMPRMTGAELVRELKRRMPQLPVVLVSGHGAQDVATAAGADAYLRKPFQLVDLARTARRLLAPLAA